MDLGYEIKAIIIDGKRGLYKAFKDYPVQMCHFHQKKVIQRYITMHPRLKAGKDLQKIMYNLTSTTQTIFTKKLNRFTKSLKLKMLDDYLVSYKKK